MKTKIKIVESKFYRYNHFYNLYKKQVINEQDLKNISGLTPCEIKMYLDEITNKNTDIKEVV